MNFRYYPDRKSKSFQQAGQGFALVVALTLLSFIFLLLLGLTTLTQIETQASVQTQRHAEARTNALFALDNALGQMQKYLGPDQRVTAPADIDLAGPLGSPGSRYWTGVWRQDTGVVGRSPKLLTWLVSGNDSSGGDGNLTVTPDQAVSDPAHGNGSVWLLGGGSVSDPDQRIKLPKQPLRDGSGATTGNFAWWVSDEGTKAHLGLVDPAKSRPDEERVYSFRTAQKTGVDGLTAWQGSFPTDDGRLPHALSRDHVSLIGDNAEVSAVLRDGTRRLFHDTTVYSEGLLADVAKGGLKKDLTSWLRGTTSPNAPKDDDYVIPVVGADTVGIGKWGLIRSYANTRDDGVDPIAPRKQEDKVQGVHPVLTYALLGFGAYAEGDGMPLQIHLFPKFIIWNPHSVPIKAADYEVGIGLSAPSTGRIIINQNTPSGKIELGAIQLHKALFGSSNSGFPNTSGEYFRFTLRVPDMPPGASMMFGVSDSDYGTEYDRDKSVLTADGSSDPRHAYLKVTLENSPVSLAGLVKENGDIVNEDSFFNWDVKAGDGSNQTRLTSALRLKPTGAGASSPWVFNTDDYVHMVARTDQSSGPSDTNAPWGLETDMRFLMVTEIGMRSGASNIKHPWLANGNYSASAFRYTKRDRGSGGTPGYVGRVRSGNINLNNEDPAYITAEPNSAHNPTPYRRSSAGSTLNVSGGRPRDLVLREYLKSGEPLFSIAQLSNVNFSDLDCYPTWALGNSLASFRIPLTAMSDTGGTQTSIIPRVYDLSYLLNETFWDRYYFSTLPDVLTEEELLAGYQPPNGRLRIQKTADPVDFVGADAFDTAAANMTVAGAFNVNSTSVEAWEALLSSLNNLEYDPVKGEPGSALDNPYSRYMQPDVEGGDMWSKSFRKLSSQQIRELAQCVVDEVRARGPFLSLADFVNRRLEAGPHGFKGALQAAIDRQSAENTVSGINRQLGWANTTDTAGKDVTANPAQNYFGPQLTGGDTSLGYEAKFPWNMRQIFTPGYLTQRDLLAVLGPVLTARSDTFVVRAYGDVVNPVTGRVEAQAWCEAVVQRIPDYVDESLQAWGTPQAGSLNDQMGRKFRIISLRWLNKDEV